MKKMILALLCVTGIGLYASQPLEISKKEATDRCDGIAGTGSITVTAAGGTPIGSFYLFRIDSEANVAAESPHTFTDVSAGLHNVTVEDLVPNSVTEFISVGAREPLSLIITVNRNPCFGQSDGSIQVEVIDPVTPPPLTYKLDGPVSMTKETPDNVVTFENLPDGLYTIEVEGKTQCGSGNQNLKETVEITFPTLTSTDPKCFGGNGTVAVKAAGGTPPYKYSINPSPVGTQQNPSNPVIAGDEVIFSNLPADSYKVSVVDLRMCTGESDSVDITNPTGIVIDSITVNDASCFGAQDGSIVINVTTACDERDVMYSIDGGSNFQGSGEFLNLAAGTYQIVIECETNDDCAVATRVLGEPDELTCTACVRGTTIEVTAFGGVGDKFHSIDGGETFHSNSVFKNLDAGTYEVQVKDQCATANCGTVEVKANTITNFIAIKYCPRCD